MAITHAASTGVSATGAARGSTSATVAYTGVAAGRLAIIVASSKSATAWGAVSGWTNIANLSGGTGTAAADTGPTRIGVWYRVLTGSETGSVTISATSGNATCAVMSVYTSSLGGWATPYAITANDATHGTNQAATSAAWAFTPSNGDLVIAGVSSDTDSTTAPTAMAFAKTGTTFGTVTNRNRQLNTTGFQNSVHTYDAPVTAHTSGSTNAMTATMTWTATSCGPMAFIHIRESRPISTLVDDFNDGTAPNPPWADNYGTVSETGGRAQVQSDTSYSAYNTGYWYSLDATGVYVRPYPAAVNGATTGEVYTAFWLNSVTNGEGRQTGARVDLVTGKIRFADQTAYYDEFAVELDYDPVEHAFWRLQLISGNLVWSTSPDASTWTTRRTLAAPAAVANAQDLRLFLETHRDSGTTNNAEFDYLNSPPPAATNANAGQAAVAADAYNATVNIQTDLSVPPATANVTTEAYSGQVALTSEVGQAAVGVAAFNATVTIQTDLSVPPATGEVAVAAYGASVALTDEPSAASVAVAAQNATVALTDEPGSASVSTDALGASVGITDEPPTANVTTDAYGATVAISYAASASTADVAVTALGATVALTDEPSTAGVTADAYNATVTTAVTAQAGTAEVTADGQGATTSTLTQTNAAADVASVGVDALSASVAITDQPDAAAVTSTAFGATVQTGVEVAAGTAAVTSTALGAQVNLTSDVGQAAVDVAAFNATVTSIPYVEVSAGTAEVTTDALSPSTAATANSGTAQVTVDAFTGSAGTATSVDAGTALVTTDAYGPAATLTTSAGTAEVVVDTNGATTTTSTSASPVAGVAEVTTDAFGPAASGTASAGTAQVVSEAYATSISGTAQAGTASVTADAQGATAEVALNVTADAGTAGVAASAFNATVVTTVSVLAGTAEVAATAGAADAATSRTVNAGVALVDVTAGAAGKALAVRSQVATVIASAGGLPAIGLTNSPNAWQTSATRPRFQESGTARPLLSSRTGSAARSASTGYVQASETRPEPLVNGGQASADV